MKTAFILFLLIISKETFASSNCLNSLTSFFKKTPNELAISKATVDLSKSLYSDVEINEVDQFISNNNFSDETKYLVKTSLFYHSDKVDINKIKLYIQYAETFRGEKLKSAILDIAQLGQREIHSSYITEFERISKSLTKKYWLYQKQMNFEEFSNLYFSCKSSTPNPKNNNAKIIFTKFSLGLSLTTMAGSYAWATRHEDKDFKWFAELGYELSFDAFTSYLGSKIQTNQNDSQLIKSLKNYFNNRLFGLADVALYPIFVPQNKNKSKTIIMDLKNSPNFPDDIKKLHQYYDERGYYAKFKEEVINTYRNLILNKSPIYIAGLNWDSLTVADLDKPEIQEVLILAATAKLYETNRGPLLDTGDLGLDRYAFTSLFSASVIPRNMVQSYISYQILCMGQKNPLLAISEATVFNASLNFFVGQVFYKLRKEAINN